MTSTRRPLAPPDVVVLSGHDRAVPEQTTTDGSINDLKSAMSARFTLRLTAKEVEGAVCVCPLVAPRALEFAR